MIPALRNKYNSQFRQQDYEAMMDWLSAQHQHRPPFPVAETPVFIPASLREKLLTGCEDVVSVITRPDFMNRSAAAVPADLFVAGDSPDTPFLQIDFGICQDEASGEYYPQLIEAQGFPSLYFFQALLAKSYRRHFSIPDDYTHLFHGLDEATYIDKLRQLITADCDPENVILLEVEPDKQATRIDFYATRDLLGVQPVCLSQLRREGRKLFYPKDGRWIPVHRIYNRVIFDELQQRTDLPRQFNLTEPVDVSWAGHPNWFFRLSKHTLPMIQSPYAPESVLVSELSSLPADLSQYVLKPLYSFAGAGVVLDPTAAQIEQLRDPQHYILQRKVQYAPVIPTPDGFSKCEIRIMMLWEPGAARPQAACNLIRLSKGIMTGVRYNKDKTWVGGSVGFFEPMPQQ
jgi:hypothetical protein